MEITKTNIFLMQTYKIIRVSVFVLNMFIKFLTNENYASSFQVEGEAVHAILAKFWKL